MEKLPVRLQALLGTGDEVVLSGLRQHVEEGAVARHADDQVPLSFRMDLGGEQGWAVDHVVLDVVPMGAVTPRP